MSRVVVGHLAFEIFGIGRELLAARGDGPALGNPECQVGGDGREDADFGSFLAVQRARLAALGLRFDDVDAESQAAFEAIGLEQRIRVCERQHAPVELAAKGRAFVEYSKSPKMMSRGSGCWVNRLSLK